MSEAAPRPVATHTVFGVYRVCAFLPALGLLAALLPEMERKKI